MSCDQELRARYKLPKSELSKLHKSMVAAANKERDAAKQALQELVDAGAVDKRGSIDMSKLDLAARRHGDGHSDGLRGVIWGAAERMRKRTSSGRKVIEVDMGEKATSKTQSFEDSYGGRVTFDREANVVNVRVVGNRAVETFDDSVAGRSFGQGLSKVKWPTRGDCGGWTVYTDEYMQEAAMDGGGAGVDRDGFVGPAGWKAHADHRGFPHPESPAGKKMASKRTSKYVNGVGSNQHRTQPGRSR